MRVLWSSASPFVGSGYGSQTSIATKRLRAMGHDVAILCYYGLEGSKTEWGDITLYPNNPRDYGVIDAPMIYDDFKADLIITLVDVWVLRGMDPRLKWVPWLPVDHDPPPPLVIEALKKCPGIIKPIAMSKFGMKKLNDAGVDCYYIPHTVNTNLFKPNEEFREKNRAKYNWQDKFVIGTIATNQVERKNWNAGIQGVKMFEAKHPGEVIYYMHTNLNDKAGINLAAMREQMKMQDYTRVPSIAQMNIGISQETLASIYNVFDVFLLPTKGEGFGIPLIEAQSCFPSETFVVGKNVKGTHERLYTGDLITIKTSKGTIEATPEHPFWTGNEWTLAGNLTINHQLWYNKEYTVGGGYARKGISKVYSGTIGDIVRTLQNNDTQGCSRKSGVDSRTGVLAGTASRSSQNNRTEGRTKNTNINSIRMGISSGINRWGGDYINQETFRKGQQLEANYLYNQYLNNVDGMVGEKNRLPQYQNRDTENSRGLCSGLPFLDGGNRVPSDFQEIATIIGNKTETLPFNNSMVSRTIKSGSSRENKQKTARDYPDVEGFKPETICEIRRRKVEKLPVYNLATGSHVYVAEGFMVHNCAVPIITTNCTAQTELMGGGWFINKLHPEWTAQASWQFNCEPEEVAERLEEAYQAKKDGSIKEKQIQAREKAMEYDEDAIYSTYWPSVLADIEKLLNKPKNMEGVQNWRLAFLPQSIVPRKVLDVGSGLTTPYKKYLETMGEYVAVDNRAEPGSGIIKADAHKLPFANKEFGFVWCSEMLEHVTDPEKVVAELKRVGNHGAILFSTPQTPSFNIDPEHRVVDPRKVRHSILATGDGCILW
jgi:glycosyltransferase involved in cell wall biosynthesis